MNTAHPNRVDAPDRPNFRVAGKNSDGQLRQSSGHGTTPASIPSKLETILYKGDREHMGFGSKDLRFGVLMADTPGPGAYTEGKGVEELMYKESWSKRGTGSFASASRRFPYMRAAGGPGPGQYALGSLIVDSDPKGRVLPSSAFAKDAKLPKALNPPERRQPGPAEYTLPDSQLKRNAGCGLRSKAKQRSMPSSTAVAPGPGAYDRSSSAPVKGMRSCRAAFAHPTQKDFVPLHQDLPKASGYGLEDDFAKPRTEASLMPGPGQYSPREAVREPTACAKGHAAFVAGNSGLPRKARSATPGPGQYAVPSCLTEKAVSSSFQWSGERGHKISSCAPGPAYYTKEQPDNKKSFHLNIRQRFIP